MDALPHHQGRPAHGIGHYLRDIVYGANDGIITTLAVVAGVAGADFAPHVALVLGWANLFADGFSMGAGNYLSLKSELEQRGESVAAERPIRHAFATLASFALAGAVPLVALVVPDPSYRFPLALAFAGAALTLVGAWRAPFVRKGRVRSALEMLFVGGVAAGVSYAVGSIAGGFV